MIKQYFSNSETNETGSVYNTDQTKTVSIPFDKYEVVVKLNESNKFIGIEEIKINKDFLSFSQKTSKIGYLDVSEFYTDK